MLQSFLKKVLFLKILQHGKFRIKLCFYRVISQNTAAQAVNRAYRRTLHLLQMLLPAQSFQISLCLLHTFAYSLTHTPDFLSTINRVFDSGIKSVQAHRTGKNLNTDISVLDSASEEINNGFFRSGHNAVGLSAGLSGSGMAFEAEWFHQNVKYLQTAGEDKELEAMLLQQRIYTVYLPDLLVFDEKTQKKEAISNQRKRWIAAQFGALRASLPHLPKAFIQGNFDYCDKICQWMLPPRLIQLAGVFGLTFVFTVIGLILSLCNGSNEWMIAIKWWILSAAQVAAMMLPVPGGRLFTKQVGKAITKMPMLALTMIGNLFKLKGANKKFIHTEHGEHHK